MTPHYSFEAEVWLYQGRDPWHFASLPADVSDAIEARTIDRKVAFGSVRVNVRIGQTTWATSLFPDKESQGYVLPLKKAVRVAEGLSEGDVVSLELELAE